MCHVYSARLFNFAKRKQECNSVSFKLMYLKTTSSSNLLLAIRVCQLAIRMANCICQLAIGIWHLATRMAY